MYKTHLLTPNTFSKIINSNIIPLPHIYKTRIKNIKIFYPLNPPPPYETIINQTNQKQIYLLPKIYTLT